MQGFTLKFLRINMRCQTELLICSVINIKREVFIINLEHLFVVFLWSKTFTNFSVSNQQDFAKAGTFESYDVIMTYWRPGAVATCKPGKPGLTNFSETLAFFFIQFISFRKMKVQDRQNGPSKSFRAYQKKLAGYAPGDVTFHYINFISL